MSTRTLDTRLGLCIVSVTLVVQLGTLLTLPGAGDRLRSLGEILAGNRPVTPLTPGTGAPEPQAAKPVRRPAVVPLVVPEGNGAPVITDGLFSPGEWDDALRVAIDPSVDLYLKQFRGVVFIGIRGDGGIGPSDLCLAVPDGRPWKLHVSAQLAETVLPREGAEPSPRFGLTTDWYANELRRDMDEAERLKQAGRSPIDIIRATSYPSEGIEFAIRRSKLPGSVWLMRLWASSMRDGKPGMLLYPPDAAERVTAGWLELRLGP